MDEEGDDRRNVDALKRLSKRRTPHDAATSTGKTVSATGGFARGSAGRSHLRVAADGADIEQRYHRNREAAEEVAEHRAPRAGGCRRDMRSPDEIAGMFDGCATSGWTS